MLQHLLTHLRGKIQCEKELLQDAAHELQTPMAVTIAQAEMVTRAHEPAARQQAQTQLENAIARASHLTRQ